MRLLAVIRVKGKKRDKKTVDTLKMLNLKNINNCVIIPKNPQYMGMLKRCKDQITFGEINQETLKKLLKKRGEVKGNKSIEEYLKESKKFKSLESISKALIEGSMTLKEIEKIKIPFRLHPPKKGWGKKGVKAHFPKGALGYRGEKINELIKRMI